MRLSGSDLKRTAANGKRFKSPLLYQLSYRLPLTPSRKLIARGPVKLLREPELFHEVLTIPEQPLVVHGAAFPVADGRHPETKRLTGGRDGLAATDRHGPRECPGHVPSHRGPIARPEPDRMLLDLDVGRIHEHRLQVRDVGREAARLVAIRPGDDDVLG